MMGDVTLRTPSRDLLSPYADALRRGWSPDNVRLLMTARERLAAIEVDAGAFLPTLDDQEACGAPIRLPDGSIVPRLPGFVRWMWDGEFCGSIGFRWVPGTSDFPPHVLGHIGFSVVPWKRCQGYAKQALALMLPEARGRGLDHVDLTTDPDNGASQKVIEHSGGVFVGRFSKGAAYGGAEALRFRIRLDETSARTSVTPHSSPVRC